MTEEKDKVKGFREMVEEALAPLDVVITGVELGSEYPFDGKELSFTLQGVVQRREEYRPYTDDEMIDMVGKVIYIDNSKIALVNHTILINDASRGTTERAVTVSGYRGWLTAPELLKRAVFRKTKEKCGVLVSSI